MNNDLTKLINIKDFELVAKNILPQSIYDYFAGGVCDEITLQANEKAYSDISIKYRVLNDVSERTTKTILFGKEINSPIIIGPTAFHALASEEGELATARAAKKSHTIFTLSTLSNCSMNEVANTVGGELWYQLYVGRNRDRSKKLVQRAEELGYKVLVITVDAQVSGLRERDIRNSFNLPKGMKVADLDLFANSDPLQESPASEPRQANSTVANLINGLHDPSLSWKDIEWFRSITRLPIVLKGIIRADDARIAEGCGINGIVVSNHGGRSLDTAPSTLSVLPDIVSAVNSKLDIIFDGGIRRGTDVLKALALGAKAIMVGRPILWGLAVGGEEGVVKVLKILNDEFDLALALSGCRSISEINTDLVGKMT